MLDGRVFFVYTDHKPLTYSFLARPDRHSPREIRHLESISQFTTDLRYVKGQDNIVTDTLDQPDISALNTDTQIDFDLLADAQGADPELQAFLKSRSDTSMVLENVPILFTGGKLICDTSHGLMRPFVPQDHRRAVFNAIHGLSHQGARATQRAIASRFIWPAENGLVERFHRQLKGSLKAHEDPTHWTEYLPLTLLGIRTTVKEDFSCSPAELLYGTTLRLPGQFVAPKRVEIDPSYYVSRLRQHMSSCTATPIRARKGRSYVPRDLFKCSHVFVRVYAVRKPFQQPYKGPYMVLKRNEKFFTISLNGKRDKH